MTVICAFLPRVCFGMRNTKPFPEKIDDDTGQGFSETGQ